MLDDTDVYPGPSEPDRLILVWHGSGPDERGVLRPLASHLATVTRARVLVPDWDSTAADGGAARLAATLAAAADRASATGVPLVLVGWSLGGTAALSVALANDARVTAVVGLAAATEHPSPLGGRTPLDLVGTGPITPIHLVHGRQDDIVDAAEAERFAAACAAAGHPITVTLIDADHAGVVGCRFDASREACLPGEDQHARNGLEAAAVAVLSTSD